MQKNCTPPSGFTYSVFTLGSFRWPKLCYIHCTTCLATVDKSLHIKISFPSYLRWVTSLFAHVVQCFWMPLYNVNHCCNFGSWASGGIFRSFFSLVLWITIALCKILNLFGYCEDIFSFELESNVLWYEPYQKFMPLKQAHLLELWDEIGIPYDEAKQVSGPILTIIGFKVDINKMSFTMPPNTHLNLILAIHEFAVCNQHPKLANLQQIAGWINWSLNVFPLLCSCLSAL